MTSITLSVESLWIYTDRFVAQCTFQQCIDYNNYWAFNCYGMSNKGVMGENKLFSSFMCQYLENGRRYVQIYYWWLIGNCICAFDFNDWHKDWWPWMTLNCYESEFWFHWFRRHQWLNEWRSTCIVGDRIVAQSMYFSVMLLGVPLLGSTKTIQWAKMAILCLIQMENIK